ncbi:Protein ULTRAPETALA 2, partial [Mucuna pruriens]
MGDDGEIKFDEEELKMIQGFKRGADYIEVVCGTTNKAYGDYIGKLKIDNKGEYSITCHCCPGCPLENVTLEEYEKHAFKEGSGRWKSNIWVHYEDEDRVPLWKTPLMKYYTRQANVANWKGAALRKRTFHRDEFMRCSRCKKERRFRLRTRPQIREYHDAFNNKSWTCSLWPYQKITCDDEEERPSLRASRACPRAATCQGCLLCYCKGCIKCRFEDCNCQECRNFMLYAEP